MRFLAVPDASPGSATSRSLRRASLIALAALLVAAALGTSSAAAATPEFNPPGSPTNRILFSMESGAGSVILEKAGGGVIPCTSMSATGEITGANALQTILHLNHCETSTGYFCRQNGSTTITTELLNGKLVYINKAAHEVGLYVEGPGGGVLKVPLVAEFSCNGTPIKLKGALIGMVSPVNSKVKSLGVSYRQFAGSQIPHGFEENPTWGWTYGYQLGWWPTNGPSERLGLEASDTLFFANGAEVEVKG